MSTPQLERLREHSHRLRLYQIENELKPRAWSRQRKRRFPTPTFSTIC
jgi:hypothetical protein